MKGLWWRFVFVDESMMEERLPQNFQPNKATCQGYLLATSNHVCLFNHTKSHFNQAKHKEFMGNEDQEVPAPQVHQDKHAFRRCSNSYFSLAARYSSCSCWKILDPCFYPINWMIFYQLDGPQNTKEKLWNVHVWLPEASGSLDSLGGQTCSSGIKTWGNKFRSLAGGSWRNVPLIQVSKWFVHGLFPEEYRFRKYNINY